MLGAALARRGWDQDTALLYLDSFSGETRALLPELIELTLSDRTHVRACEAISHLPHEALIPALEPLIAQRLDREDEYEYRYLGGLLGRIQAWDLLRGLIQRALNSPNPEIIEVGRDFEGDYAFLGIRHESRTEPNP